MIEEQRADFTAFLEQVENCRVAFAEIVTPIFNEVMRVIRNWLEILQRYCLFIRLARWLPDGVAWWLSQHCPACWLPEINWETCE